MKANKNLSSEINIFPFSELHKHLKKLKNQRLGYVPASTSVGFISFAESYQIKTITMPDICSLAKAIKNEQELLTKLQEGRNVILTDTIKKHYNVEIGDKITLPFERRDREYTVIGFIDTMMNDGHIGLLPLKYYKLYFHW